MTPEPQETDAEINARLRSAPYPLEDVAEDAAPAPDDLAFDIKGPLPEFL